jgi:hypothetical protein
MTQMILKFVISASVIVAVSEISKRSSFIGGLLASLPLTSLLAMIWLWHDTRDAAKIGALATSIFWFVLPSLILFIVLPVLIKHGVTFWLSLLLSVGAVLAGYSAMVFVLTKLGIKL